jgi:hypothetical protein
MCAKGPDAGALRISNLPTLENERAIFGFGFAPLDKVLRLEKRYVFRRDCGGDPSRAASQRAENRQDKIHSLDPMLHRGRVTEVREPPEMGVSLPQD